MTTAHEPSVVPVHVFHLELPGSAGHTTFPLLELRCRDASGAPMLRWVFQRHLERALYARAGDGGSTGAIWKLMNQHGLGRTALVVNVQAVAAGLVTDAERDEVLACFKRSSDGLDPSSLGRVRACTLLPLATAATVCRVFGKSPASEGFLRLFAQPVPQAWELQAQAEADHEAGEYDLLLHEQLEAGVALELEEVESFSDELTQMAPFERDPAEEGRMSRYTLTRPTPALTAELAQYVASRTATFDARRAGAAVVSATVEGDTNGVLRFFGYLHHTQRTPEGAALRASTVLARADLGALVQAYAEWLRETQQLRCSSIANYLTSIANVTKWVYRTFDVPAATAAMEPSPLAQVHNLRGQAESTAKTENLFDKRVGGWIEWADVHKARLEAVRRAHAAVAADRLRRWKDAVAVGLLSLIPPDRVGVVRKLRLDHTLKRRADGGWAIDLTKQRDGHKTSKFYGPFAAALPLELAPLLDAYTAQLELADPDAFRGAYLFHPPTSAPDRPMDGSSWTHYVRGVFQRLTGTAIAPKTLRSSFITWLRESTDSPEVLKSAAHAMKHQTATQASRHYDANADTALVKAAYDFNLQFAARFAGGGPPPPAEVGEVDPPPPPAEVVEVEPPPPGVEPASPARAPRFDAPELKATLAQLGFVRQASAGNGDCFLLSAMAGFEIGQTAARLPSPAVSERVRVARDAAVGAVCSPDPIGGEVDAAAFRDAEGLAPSPAEAYQQMARWREPRFWLGDDSSTFQLGVALQMGRPLAVVQRAGRKHFVDPARIYGARAADGRLVLTRAHGIVAPTVPAYVVVPVRDLLEQLRARPTAFSVLEYDGSCHFDAWVLRKQMRRPPRAPLEATAPPSPAASVAATESHEARPSQCSDSADDEPMPPRAEEEVLVDFEDAPGDEAVLLEADAVGAPADEAMADATVEQQADEADAIDEVDGAPNAPGEAITAADDAPDDAPDAPDDAVVDAPVPALPNNVPATVTTRASTAPRRSTRAPGTPRVARRGAPASAADVHDVRGVSVGDELLARGFAPCGERAWFRSRVLALRVRAPHIVVRFLATETGASHPLALPRPITAYVNKPDTRPLP